MLKKETNKINIDGFIICIWIFFCFLSKNPDKKRMISPFVSDVPSSSIRFIIYLSYLLEFYFKRFKR